MIKGTKGGKKYIVRTDGVTAAAFVDQKRFTVSLNGVESSSMIVELSQKTLHPHSGQYETVNVTVVLRVFSFLDGDDAFFNVLRHWKTSSLRNSHFVLRACIMLLYGV